MQLTLNVFKSMRPSPEIQHPHPNIKKSQSLWPMLCVQKDIQTLKMELFMLFLYIFAEAEIEGQKGFDNGVQNTSVHSSSP